MEDKTLRRKVT